MLKQLRKKIKAYKELKSLAKDIKINHLGSIDLYGIYADRDLIAPVPDYIKTKNVKYLDTEVGCISTKILEKVFLTEKEANIYLKIYLTSFVNPEIWPISAATGNAQEQVSKVANLLKTLFN